MKASRFVVVAGASATMLAAGWRAGVAPLPSLVIADNPAGGAVTSDSGATPAPTASAPAPDPNAPATATDPAPATATDPAPAPKPAPAGPSGTFVGSAVKTSYGTMQVQVVVSNGRIVDVQPLVIGFGDAESRQINSRAVPILEQRVLGAQSAKVSYVSGASYTSQGYLASVASALAKAGL